MTKRKNDLIDAIRRLEAEHAIIGDWTTATDPGGRKRMQARLGLVPGDFVAAAAMMGGVVVTLSPWLDPDDGSTRAELASYMNTDNRNFVVTAEKYRELCAHRR